MGQAPLNSLNSIVFAWMPIGAQWTYQNGIETESITGQHISEDPITHHRNPGGVAMQLLFKNLAKCAPAGLCCSTGEADPQLFGNLADPLPGWIVAEQVELKMLPCVRDPGHHRLRQDKLMPRQQGAIHIQENGLDISVEKMLKR